MDKERIQELALTLALGAAGESELREFQELWEKYPTQAADELAQARRLVEHLVFSLPDRPLPVSVKQRLLRNVQTLEALEAKTSATVRPLEIKKPSPKLRPRFSRMLSWAAMFLVVALAYGNFSLREQSRRLQDELKGLRDQLAERQSAIAQLESQLAQQQRLLQVMRAPQLQLVDLQSLKPELQSRGRVLIDRSALRAVFSAENLPALPEDRDYELWYIMGNAPVRAGVFQVDETGGVAFEIAELPEDLTGIHTFAVTLEPKGGVPQPTGPMFLAGKVSG